MVDTLEPLYPNFAKTYHLLREQLPQFLDEDGSNLEDILTVYYEYLDNNVTDSVDMRFRNIDEVDEDFVEYFMYEFAKFAKDFDQPIADKRRLIKYTKEMYQKKGTVRSFELFFRLLFNEDPTVYVTKSDVLYCSAVDLSYQNRIAFNIGNSNYTALSSTQNLVKISVLKQELDIIKTIKEENLLYVYFRNDLTVQPKVSEPGQNPDRGEFLFENTRVFYPISSSTTGFDVKGINAYGFNILDKIELLPKTDNQNTSDALYQISDTTRGPITSFTIFNSGEGYVTGDYIKFVEGTTEYVLRLKADEVTGEVIGLKTSGYRQDSNGGYLEIFPPTDEWLPLKEIKLPSDIGDRILFQSTPEIQTQYTNKFGDVISTVHGTGLKIAPVLKGSGKIANLDFVDYGTGLDFSNTKVKELCTMLVSDPDKVGGNPIVELYRWEPQLDKFVGTSYGGRIINHSPSKSRISIQSVSGKKASQNRELKSISTAAPSWLKDSTATFKLVVIEGSTGKILNDDYTYGHDIQILPLNTSSFNYGAVSEIKRIDNNDRNVLSSLNARLRDKEYYHEYAFIIKSGVSAFSWSKMFKESVHPAGFKFVPELDTFNGEELPGTITIGRSIQNENIKEIFLDEGNNYGFPNRVIRGVEDDTRIFQSGNNSLNSSIYNTFPKYVPGFQVDIDKKLQYSDAFLLQTKDETNGLYLRTLGQSPIVGQRKVYEVDYNAFFLNTLFDENAYERFTEKTGVNELTLPARPSPPLNTAGKVVSTSSTDENYWHAGWAKHSSDLYDRRNAYTTEVDSEEGLIVYSAFTNYNGNPLERSLVAFPNGNTPVRFRKITRDDQNNYSDKMVYQNDVFPADKRQVNPLKRQLEEVNNCPDRGPYFDFDDAPELDTTVATVTPNTRVNLIGGVVDFSLTLALEDPIRLNLGDDYIDIDDYRDRDIDGDGNPDDKIYIDSFFDHEPKGFASDRTLQEVDLFDPTKTIGREVIYGRYDGTDPDGKTDDWYDPREDNNPAAFINIEYTMHAGDTDKDGLPVEYDLLSASEMTVVNFVDFSDDKKQRYDGIVYPQSSQYKIRPRKYEVYVKKEQDLQEAIEGSLVYTRVDLNGLSTTYTGVEAFNQIWRI